MYRHRSELTLARHRRQFTTDELLFDGMSSRDMNDEGFVYVSVWE